MLIDYIYGCSFSDLYDYVVGVIPNNSSASFFETIVVSS